MTDQTPITPPPELVEHNWNTTRVGGDFAQEFAAFFAQWGADQELEACLLLVGDGRRENLSQVIALRTARRPKTPSLKEQALDALGPEPQPKIGNSWDTTLNCRVIERHRLVRRALEALDD